MEASISDAWVRRKRAITLLFFPGRPCGRSLVPRMLERGGAGRNNEENAETKVPVCAGNSAQSLDGFCGRRPAIRLAPRSKIMPSPNAATTMARMRKNPVRTP